MKGGWFVNEYSMEDFNIIIPEYLEQSDSLGALRSEDLLSGDQQESDPSTRSGEENEISNGESEDLSDDYSSVLNDISSGVDSLDSTCVELQAQIDNLNNNLVTLQEDNKITVGLLFSLVFLAVVKVGFSIFNKILGLNQV